MSGEVDVVLASLTDEELDDAVWFLHVMHGRWKESRRRVEQDGRDALMDAPGYHGTEGPLHALRALDLAIVGERAIRGGAQPWFVGMSPADHPGRSLIEYYQERITLNPDQGIRPRLSEVGVLERVCTNCGEAKPLTVRFWEWLETTFAEHCRTCRITDVWTPEGRRQMGAERHRIAQVLLEAQEAQAPAPEPVAAWGPAEVAEEPSPWA